MPHRRNTEEKIKVYAGFIVMGLVLTALYYPQQSICLGFVFLMILAWMLGLLDRPRSRK